MSIEKDTVNFINQEENMSIEKKKDVDLKVIYRDKIKKMKETKMNIKNQLK